MIPRSVVAGTAAVVVGMSSWLTVAVRVHAYDPPPAPPCGFRCSPSVTPVEEGFLAEVESQMAVLNSAESNPVPRRVDTGRGVRVHVPLRAGRRVHGDIQRAVDRVVHGQRHGPVRRHHAGGPHGVAPDLRRRGASDQHANLSTRPEVTSATSSVTSPPTAPAIAAAAAVTTTPPSPTRSRPATGFGVDEAEWLLTEIRRVAGASNDRRTRCTDSTSLHRHSTSTAPQQRCQARSQSARAATARSTISLMMRTSSKSLGV